MLAHPPFGRHRGVFAALTHIVDPMPPSAGLGISAAGFAAFLGWRPGPVGRALVACCLATLVAIVLKDELKYAFGRLWPGTWVENDPSLVRDGAYGFFPFHGGRGWFSCPSGHATVVSAPIAVLCVRLPRLRLIPAIPVLLAAAGLFGADHHFVGDLMSGLYLGTGCGLGALALLREPVGTRLAPPP